MTPTDIWRCKRCNTLPDIKHVAGKFFIIRCEICQCSSTEVHGDTVDRVVALWNRRNTPLKAFLYRTTQRILSMIRNIGLAKKKPSAAQKTVRIRRDV
jgi:hypothetical protein